MTCLEPPCPFFTQDAAAHFGLKVSGTSEYLERQQCLRDYEYVHQCYKLDRDVKFRLVDLRELRKPYLRTAEDDQQDANVRLEDISPKDQGRRGRGSGLLLYARIRNLFSLCL